MCAYENTINKSAIRQVWNRPILENWSRRLASPLTYFGLPGPRVHDFIDWHDLLDRRRTAIESPGRTKKEKERAAATIGVMNFNVGRLHVDSGFQLLRADVEDVILNGHDLDGSLPQMNDGRTADAMRFGYDLWNLDFDGGFGYTDKHGTGKRVEAFRRLFAREEGHGFLLLLTINVRDTLGEAIENYLQGMRSRTDDRTLTDIVDWYISRGDGERAQKLKVVVPCFLQHAAEARGFKIDCKPPVAYEGHEKARMIHFAFELEWCPGALRGFSSQSEWDIMRLPLVRCNGGDLRLALDQYPQFDRSQCGAEFQFLPDDVRLNILRTAAT